MNRIEAFLVAENFARRPDGVWQRGRGFMTSPLFVVVAPRERAIYIEGWVSFTLLPSVYIGEMGVEGLFYVVPKRKLKARLQQIEAIAARRGS